MFVDFVFYTQLRNNFVSGVSDSRSQSVAPKDIFASCFRKSVNGP